MMMMTTKTTKIAGDDPSVTSETTGTAEEASNQGEVFKLAPFNPSSAQIQEIAFDLLALDGETDVLFDLGCGDGRLLVAAAQKHQGLRCVGVEIDPLFVSRANKVVGELPPQVRDCVEIRLEDAFHPLPRSKTESSGACSGLTLMDDATALYLFILPKGIQKLLPLLEALVENRRQSGKFFRVVSFLFQVRAWEPTRVNRSSKGGCPVYLYEFPATP